MSEMTPVPLIVGECKFTADIRYRHVRANLAYGFRDLYELIMLARPTSTPAVIITGGASVNGQVDEIKRLQREGAVIFVIVRMFQWAVGHGIIPDYVVSLDAPLDKAPDSFMVDATGTKFLISSISQPETNVRLRSRADRVYLFTPRAKEGEEFIDHEITKIFRAAGINGHTVVKTGSSVALTAKILALILGYGILHFFGFDCKYLAPPTTTTDGYAEGIIGTGVEQECLSVRVAGKDILTNKSFISYAQQFFLMADWMYKQGKLRELYIHGDSLLTDMWDGRFLNEQVSSKLPAADQGDHARRDAGGPRLAGGPPATEPPG